jgi:hypothetical protein
MNNTDRLQIDPGFEDRRAAFHADLLRDDDVGMVVRAHQHIERELKLFIEMAAPSPGRFRKLTYSKRVDVAIEHGLIRDLEGPLRAIGRMRNRLAHELGASVGKADPKKLYESFGLVAKNITETSYARTYAKLGPAERPERIELLDPKEQCAFHFVTIWAAIVAQTHHLKRSL